MSSRDTTCVQDDTTCVTSVTRNPQGVQALCVSLFYQPAASPYCVLLTSRVHLCHRKSGRRTGKCVSVSAVLLKCHLCLCASLSSSASSSYFNPRVSIFRIADVRTGSWTGPLQRKRAPSVGMSSTVLGVRASELAGRVHLCCRKSGRRTGSA